MAGEYVAAMERKLFYVKARARGLEAEAEKAEALAAAAQAQAAEKRKGAQAAEQEVGDLEERIEAAKHPEASLEASKQQEDAAEAARSRDASAQMTGAKLKGIPAGDKIAAFTLLDDQEKPSLSEERRRAIAKALDAIADKDYDCGFVFADLASGKGIAYNADAEFYSASAFKAALALYALERQDKEDDAELSDYDRNNIEAAILYSDNDAYDEFAANQMGSAYLKWLDGYDIDYDDSMPYYANASAISMARIWADLFQYIRSGTSDAKWLAKLLANTNRSFIRDAVESKRVTVRNKAGWIAECDLSSLADCAYIDDDGHPYLMVVLTDQPDSGAGETRASNLAKALFAARDQIG